MRAEGKTWVEIAEDFRQRYGGNARVAMRWAHGWTQAEVAGMWSARWDDDPKDERNISNWERWPESGHAPSLAVLGRLARIYECDVADLVSDLKGYRHLDQAVAADEVGPPALDLTGLWHSRYRYPTSGEEREGEHYVVISHHDGGCVVGESLPHSKGSRLKLDLSFHAPAATGTWTEWTSPRGRYRGAPYHGSIQLMVDPSGRSMVGKWVGFSRSFSVKSGEWSLTWLDKATDEAALREYHLKV